MDIINREIDMFDTDCDVVLFYNVNSRLTVFIYGSKKIGDLKAKFW